MNLPTYVSAESVQRASALGRGPLSLGLLSESYSLSDRTVAKDSDPVGFAS